MLLLSAPALAEPRLDAAILLELHERGAEPAPANPAVHTLRIFADGRYATGEGAGGLLGKAQLAELRARLGRTRLVMKSAANLCDALPTSTLELRIRRGSLSWQLPCSPEPDPSVTRLVDLARRLTARPSR